MIITTTDSAPGQGRRGPTVGVRARILATVLVLAAIGMTVAGTSFSLFERSQAMNHLDAVLTADVRQLEGVGAAAPAGTAVREVLRAALLRHVPTDGEMALTFVDGRPGLRSPEADAAQLPEEKALLDVVTAMPADSPVVLRQISTARGPLRFVAVQVRVPGRPEVGTYVVGIRLQPVLDQLSSSAKQYAVLSLVVLALIGIGGWVVAGRLLRPLRLLRETAQGVSHAELTWRIPVRGRDDVSELTQAVNGMLDRLEEAFDTQQRFLDDAGHELRTPLTVIRGHLELLDANDPTDVQATRSLVMGEVDRMTRLVNDLIVLAQAQRPDFVQFEPVDLDQLLRDLVDKAVAMAERNWVLDATVPAVVMADGHRLTQAMLQLVDNAVKHTGPQDEIGIGGVISRGQVQLWVRDTGSGVAPEDRERIFDRFARAAATASDRRSSGLGLSIVGGIAAAHGGSVELDPAPPPGARFTLQLPLTIRAWLRTPPGSRFTSPPGYPYPPAGGSAVGAVGGPTSQLRPSAPPISRAVGQ